MKAEKERDNLLLEIAQSGAISVTDKGVVTNNITGKEIGFVTGGYKRINMFGATFAVNRLVYLVYIGEIPDDYEVNHIDGDKLNNAKENLEAVTPGLNKIHARVTGLLNDDSYSHLKLIDNSGANNGMAKLSAENVNFYREAFDKSILSIKEISIKTGMRRKSVTDMLNAKTYKNVEYRITRSTWFEEN